MADEGQLLALCWGSVEGGGLFDLAETACAADVTGIAVTPRQYMEQEQAGLSGAQMRLRLSEFGVRVSVIDPLISALPGTPPPHSVAEWMRWMVEATQEDCWRAAEALECPIINMGHFQGSGVSEAELSDAMARITLANRAHGCATTIEFIPGTGVPDLVAAGRMTRDVPDLGIMFDCWHYARSDGKLEDFDTLAPGAFGGVQVNDWLPPEPGTPYIPMSGRLIPGDGCLPIAELLARIQANTPGLEIGIEVFSSDLRELGWKPAARLMAERTRGMLSG